MEQKTKETGKRWKIGLIVILALALVLIGINFVYFTGFAIEQESKELTVGVVVPLSGDLAIIGEEMQRGVELRLDDARAEKFGIKVIYEDDQSLSAVAAVNAANKLTSIDRVDAGLTAIVEEAHPMGPIFERNEIPLLVAWDSNEWIQDSGEYTFSTGFSTEKTGAKLAGYAYNELGMRRVAIVSHIESFSQIISEAFTNEFEARGGEIVLHEEHLLDDVDYRTTISKIKALDVDGVYFPLIPPTSVHFLKQVEELDLEVQLLSADPLIQDVIDATGDVTEGTYYTNIYSYSADPEEIRQKYIEKYGSEPLDLAMVSFGYEGLSTIIEAKKKNPEDLRQGLEDIIGKSRSLDRVEKIFVVKNGVGIPIE